MLHCIWPWMNKVGELCVAFIYQNANIDLRKNMNYVGRRRTRGNPADNGRYQDSLERFSRRSELRPGLFIIYAFRRH